MFHTPVCLIAINRSTSLFKLLKIILWNETWATVCQSGFSSLPESLSFQEAEDPIEPRFQERR